MKTCTVDGCTRPHRCKGLCEIHYSRKRNGNDNMSPELLRYRRRPPLLESFERTSVDECWPWLGNLSHGYGRWVGDVHAHRAVYEALIGPLPAGLDLDHLCHNRDTTCPGGTENCVHRRCVNPAHLEPVPRRVNVLRGAGPSAVNARKDECIHGHPFDAANTYINRDGWRGCRTCNRERRRHYRAKARAAS